MISTSSTSHKEKLDFGMLFGFVASAVFVAHVCSAEVTPVKIGVYKQEVSTNYDGESGLPSGEVLSVAAGTNGTVYAGTDKGVSSLQGVRWSAVKGLPETQAAALAVDGDRVLAAVGDGLYEISGGTAKRVAALPSGSVNGMARKGDALYLATERGLYRLNGKRFAEVSKLNALLGNDRTIYCVAVGAKGAVALGAESGLFSTDGSGNWTQLFPSDARGRSWAPRNVRGVAFDERGRLWFASPQGVGCLEKEWTLYTGHEGLPYNDFITMSVGEPGVVWFGTRMGAIRFDGKNWAYRQGRRWLPNDEVRAISVNANGDAWFATASGVGLIERRPMTLAEKAEFYEDEMEKYIRRTEYGYVCEVGLEKPGDKSKIIYHDSDNDGLWTSMYGAGECFAYAATKDPKAKDRAKRAFEALRFLSVAPVGGEVDIQPGYVARTVVPTTERDPNLGYTLESQQRNRDSGDSLWKVYTPRWPKTADGKYWYKTDTSSDELDGHYFFYPAYYDLVAETEAEKERVREVVRNITDHLVRNDFCLIDHDGTPTRWSVYSPEALNYDRMWHVERGLKSLSILSYLAVAEHITGDAKYGEASKRLLEEHAFGTNAMVAKIQHGIGSGNQSDDEMAVMCFYNLIKYTKNEELREEMVYSFLGYWVNDYPEMNPFFNFAYAVCGIGTQYTDPWGTHDLSPWGGWLEDSIETLKGFPLDRLDWSLKNSHRLDILRLPGQVVSEPYLKPDPRRGYRVNGKVLPVEERFFNHWNTDPWALDYGGGGRGLASGAVFLLPYYMGLYHDFIQ